MAAKPLIGITGCSEARPVTGGEIRAWYAKEQYIHAVWRGAAAVPVLLPGDDPADEGDLTAIDSWLDRLHGIVVTGALSNVEPGRYGGVTKPDGSVPEAVYDRARDRYTLALIRRAVERAVPLFAICRGHQEMNVAFGGTLHQRVQEVPGRFDHRANPDDPIDRRFAPVHKVTFPAGGFFAGLAGKTEAMVNSYHWQGIDRLADPLEAAAFAEDGTVEATIVRDAPGFAISTQWHPEWRFAEDPLSTALFLAFGEAARQQMGLQPSPAQAAE